MLQTGQILVLYVLWFVWNILTARLYVQTSFAVELFAATVYFGLLSGFMISLCIILLT